MLLSTWESTVSQLSLSIIAGLLFGGQLYKLYKKIQSWRPDTTSQQHFSFNKKDASRVRGGEQTLQQACSQEYPGSARCVQSFDDSLDSAIRITYRISLRSSSMWEPRHPSLKVVLNFHHVRGAGTFFKGKVPRWIRGSRFLSLHEWRQIYLEFGVLEVGSILIIRDNEESSCFTGVSLRSWISPF